MQHLIEKKLGKDKTPVLNLGSKFSPTYIRDQPYMNIIQIKKTCTTELENNRYVKKLAGFWQGLVKTQSKDIKTI